MARRAERDDVADRRDARHVRSILRVDLDVALLDLQPDAFGVEPGGHRPAAGRDQQVVGAECVCDRAVGELGLDVDAVGRRLSRP